MTDLALDPEQFARELRVVQEERRQRVDDNPRSLTYERMRAAAFPSSPTRSPIIGWPADLDSMTVRDIGDWYQRFYGPNNATLVVVGDVDPDEVHRLARKHFGPLEPIEPPTRKAPTELSPRGEQRLRVHAPGTLSYLALAWRVPSLTTVEDPRDAYALDVIVGLLDGGRSARIDRNVVRGRAVASSAAASYSLLARSDSLFSIGATPAQGHDVAAVEQALREEIEHIKAGEISAEELARVKTRVRAKDVFRRDSMFYQALRMGTIDAVGLEQEAYDRYQAGLKEVTVDDVQRVARRYLTERRLTVAELVPEGVTTGDGAAAGGNPAAESDHVR